MPSAQTRFVGFDGRQVAVSSACSEILVPLEKNFLRMLQPEGPNPVAWIEAGKKDDGYYFLHPTKWVRSYSLREVAVALNNEVTLCFVLVRPDLIWLHAGAAAFQGRA